MPGLRERKKQQRRERILGVALDLFLRDGYSRTSMRDIAAGADVGVGTIYNYFESKTDLLAAVFERETAVGLARGEEVLSNSGLDPLEKVKALMSLYVRMMVGYPLDLIREAMLATRLRPGPMTNRFVQLDMEAMAQLSRLLADLQQEGAVSGEFEPNEQAMVLYGIVLTWLMMAMMAEEPEVDRIEAQILRQTELVFQGLAPRRGEPWCRPGPGGGPPEGGE